MTRLPKIERKVEYKPVLTEIKAVDQAQGILEGYLNVKNVEDLGGDISRDGCFRKTLQDSHARKRSQNLQGLWPFLYNHSYESIPPGLVVDAAEDKKGLWIRAQLFMDQEKARDLYGAYAQGGLNSFSMGYKAHQVSWEKINGRQIRNLIEVQIMECSSVVFPMNTDSTVTAIKGRQDYNMLLRTKDFTSNYMSQQLSDWQDDWGGISNALQQSILDLFVAGGSPLQDFETDVAPQLLAALRQYIQEGVDLNYSNAPSSAQGVYAAMSMSGASGESKSGYLTAQNHVAIHAAAANIMKYARSIHSTLGSLSQRYNESVGQPLYSSASPTYLSKEEEADIANQIKLISNGLELDMAMREAKQDLLEQAPVRQLTRNVENALQRVIESKRK
jgi:HK97 family phage prohead protease